MNSATKDLSAMQLTPGDGPAPSLSPNLLDADSSDSDEMSMIQRSDAGLRAALSLSAREWDDEGFRTIFISFFDIRQTVTGPAYCTKSTIVYHISTIL